MYHRSEDDHGIGKSPLITTQIPTLWLKMGENSYINFHHIYLCFSLLSVFVLHTFMPCCFSPTKHIVHNHFSLTFSHTMLDFPYHTLWYIHVIAHHFCCVSVSFNWCNKYIYQFLFVVMQLYVFGAWDWAWFTWNLGSPCIAYSWPTWVYNGSPTHTQIY